MMSIIKRLAQFLPADVVFGESYRHAKRILNTFNATADKIDFVNTYQQKKLDGILQTAAKAPYYSYIQKGADVENLPFISKELIVASFDDFIVSKDAADYVTTGGTSGKPLGFYIDKNRKGFEWFWMTSNWGKVGFNINEYRAVLRNNRLQGKQFKKDPLLKEYQYNNFSLNDDYLGFIVDHINARELKFLHAYPSAAYMLASYLKKYGKSTTLKAFLCGSENIFRYQKELIQDELNIRMYTWFGHSEKLILAGEGTTCENNHHNPFYGYAEIIGEDGKPVKEPGGIGELVGTGFINTKMPFIRYKTGDFAEYVGESCPHCGHIGFTFRNIKGRWYGDKIYKNDGASVTTTALNLHNSIYNYIKGLQYFQNEKGKLQVRVVPETNYDNSIKTRIKKELESKSGDSLQIEVVEVDAVELSVNNKFQLLIQKIADQ